MQIKAPVDHYFKVSNALLHYLDWGGTGHPIILLHGLQDTARNWDHVAEHLTSLGHVYALDARGHGDSEHVPGHYQFSEYVLDVNAFLEELDAKKAILIGHSAGGKYAFTQAARNPSRLSGLIIVDMDPDAVNRGSSVMFERYLSEDDEWDTLQSVIERLRLREPKALNKLLEHIALIMTKRMDNQKFAWKRDRHVISEYERPDAWDTLSMISVPTLIIRGAESTLLRREIAELMQSKITGSRLAEIPHGGHWCVDENPESFLREITKFIETI
jgi:pimeloyl-ACP methyl ester carboxylesterase